MGTILLREQSLNPRHWLTKCIVEVRVSGRGFLVRVSYLLQQAISRHPVGLEHGDEAVTKRVQAYPLAARLTKDFLRTARIIPQLGGVEAVVLAV